ncbi:cytochrome P450 [Amniculicola lignicola CBS 123094]|uniref:Cytochrome P450 n=1 Tax=Amniculicola lignicola CBS 123094 TaxID=1392246 RepID=A0A6A5W198_9PLEO|nr:cytochrome P450 [Amniculicola lignicola CBS 123094]
MFRALGSHKFHLWSQQHLEKHNHTVELRMFGEKLVMTDDPENIRAIQETQFSEFAKSEEQRIIFHTIFGDAIFGMNGEEWKAEAALYRVHLSHVRDSVLTVTERYITTCFAFLDREGNDAADIIDRFQLDVVTEIFLGESANSLTSNQEHFRTALETLQKIACLRQLLGRVGVWLDDKFLAPQAVRYLQNYQNTMADNAFLRSGDGTASSTCLIDGLIRQGKSRQDVRNAVTSILTAGKDPSVTVLAYAIYEIAKRPEVFTKMKAEVEENIGSNALPTLANLRKLKYIRMVIKETLRNHHPLGYHPRVPVKDITLPRGGGPDGLSPVAILKGAQIIYSLLSLQNRENLSANDASNWRPERWETWKPTSKWEYIPFNHGPRICPGQQFANVQMEYFLTRLCQEYESISLTSESRPQEGLMRLELNTKLAFPVYAKFVRKDSK